LRAPPRSPDNPPRPARARQPRNGSLISASLVSHPVPAAPAGDPSRQVLRSGRSRRFCRRRMTATRSWPRLRRWISGRPSWCVAAGYPAPAGVVSGCRRWSPIRAMTRSLQGMSDRLTELGVTRVVMEATSDYWKPAFYLLEVSGFEVWLVNAKDVKGAVDRPGLTTSRQRRRVPGKQDRRAPPPRSHGHAALQVTR